MLSDRNIHAITKQQTPDLERKFANAMKFCVLEPTKIVQSTTLTFLEDVCADDSLTPVKGDKFVPPNNEKS